MAITRFVYLLLGLSILFLFIKKDEEGIKTKDVVKPIVTFKESVMYDLSTNNIEHILQSKKAELYKDHEELFDATLLARAKKSDNSEDINNITSDTVVKYDEKIYFNGNVVYNSYDGLIFKTEELEYNTESKIAKTDTRFYATKGQNDFTGSSLIYDSINGESKAEDTRFKIDLKEKMKMVNSLKAVLIILISFNLYAEENYLNIDAKHFESNEKTQTMIFKDDVKMTKNNDILLSEHLLINTQPAKNNPKKQIPKNYKATGNVSFVIHTENNILKGKGDTLYYYPQEQKYIIVGNGYLEDKEGKKINADTIYIDEKTGHTRIDGDSNKPAKFRLKLNEE